MEKNISLTEQEAQLVANALDKMPIPGFAQRQVATKIVSKIQSAFNEKPVKIEEPKQEEKEDES